MKTVEEAERNLQTLVCRNQKLCKRWRLIGSATVNEYKQKEYLLNKLPVRTAKEVTMLQWDAMSYYDFVLQCKRVHNGLQRQSEIGPDTAFVAAAEADTEVIDAQETAEHANRN